MRGHLLPGVCLLVGFALAPTSTAAAQSCDLHVNASDGHDDATGELARPLRSFELAYRTVAEGGRVCVAAGEYYLGDDSDGIRLDESGKSVTFELNAFAGQSEVRFSEKSFLVDAGGGRIVFASGTASQLVFGNGLLNADLPSEPNLINFLHTISFTSGSVQFEGVSALIESVVGIPGRANPANSAKVAPDSARVSFVGASLSGTLSLATAPRTIEIADSQFRLPPDLADNTLVFSGGAVTMGSLNLPRGRLRFENDALVTFSSLVDIAESDVPIRAEQSFAGTATFQDEVTLTGAFPPLAAILNLGSGSLEFAQLALGAASQAVLGATPIENSGGGQTSILRFATGRAWAPDVRNLRGQLNLGIGTAEMNLNGALTNAAEIQIRGPVLLSGYSALPNTLNNTGSIELVDSNLSLTNTNGTHFNSGAITGTGRLIIPVAIEFGGAGSLPAVLVEAAGVLELGAGSFRFGESLTVDGTLRSVAGANLVVGGDLSVSGSLDGITGVTMAGTDRQNFDTPGEDIANLTLDGAGVDFASALVVSGTFAIQAGSHVLGATGTVGLLHISGGALTTAGAFIANGIDLSGGILTVSAGGQLRVATSLAVTGGELTGGEPYQILFGGDLSATTPIGGSPTFRATGPGTQRLALGASPTLAALELGPAATLLVLESDLTVQASLALGSATMLLGADLTLESDLSWSTGGFDTSGVGRLILSGATVTVSPGGDPGLPSVQIAGADVLLDGDARIAGSFSLQSGSLSIGPARTLTVSGSGTINGAVSLDTGGRLHLMGSSTIAAAISGGMNAVVQLDGDAAIANGALELASSTLELGGTNQLVSFSGELALDALLVSGASVTLTGGSTVNVGARLQVDGMLDSGSTSVSVTPVSGPAILQVNTGGTYTGLNPVLLADPLDLGIRLSGDGAFGSLTVGLQNATRSIKLTGASLGLAGTLRLELGGLDLNGGTLNFIGPEAGLALNVEDGLPTDGAPDGTRIEGGSINPGGDTFHLAWFGSVRQFYSPTSEFMFGPIGDLSFDIRDAINSPAVFGARIDQDLIASGDLAVAPGTVVRLSADLSMLGSGRAHFVGGRIEGTGSLLISDAVRVSGGAQGQISALALTGPTNRVTELSVGQVDFLDIRGVHARVLESGRPGGFVVTHLAQISDATLEIRSRMELATDASLVAASGNLVIGADHALYLGHSSVLEMDAGSSVTLSEAPTSSAIPDGGFIVLTGDTEVLVGTPIPRLRVAALQQSGSDDISLGRDLTITDQLVVVDGDLFLDRFTLLLEGADWHSDTNGSPFDGPGDSVFGDFSGLGGDVVLSGPGFLRLGGDLDLFSANLRMRGVSDQDTVRVRSGDGPHSIRLSNKQFSLERGVLDLGLNDLVLEGSSEAVLLVSGGRLVGAAQPTLPLEVPGFLTASALFPYDDDDYGELVLGAGNASIELAASASLDNVRLRGNLRMPDSGRTLTVNKRLAVGRRGAVFRTIGDGQLQLGEGAVLVQQGDGRLTHRPGFGGAYDLFYDLHDGTLAGTASGFAGGTFSAGLELTAGFGEVRNLGVLASGGSSVGVSSDLRVSGSLLVYAGTAAFGNSELSIAEGGGLYLVSLDASSLPVLSTGIAYTTEGAISVGLSQPAADLILSEAIWPASAQVGSLDIHAGGTFDSRVFLVGNRTAGSITINLADPSDVFNLNGHQLTATESFRLQGGTMTSGPLATVSSRGGFEVSEPALITGAVAVDVDGDALISGQFGGLILQVAGDLTVAGDLGASASLVFAGSDQRFTLAGGDEQVSSVSMSQSESTALPVVRLIGGNLGISSSLRLTRGLLDSGNHRIILPAASESVIRLQGATSHVVGTVSRTVLAGTSESYEYPVGGREAYRPIRVAFDNLISTTTFSVNHIDEIPIGKAGFPVEIVGRGSVRDVAPYGWAISSSVNFAESQQYDIEVQVATADAAVPARAALVAQNAGSLASWTAPGSSSPSQVVDDRLVVSSVGITGGLSPLGSLYAVGIDELRQSQRGSLQAIHADASPGSERIQFFLDSRLGREFDFGETSPAVPFELEQPTTIDAASDANGTRLAEAPLELRVDRRTYAVLGPNGRILSVEAAPEMSPFLARVVPILFHSASDLGRVVFSYGDQFVSMDPGEGIAVTSVLAVETDFVVSDPDGRVLVAHRFDLALFAGETVAIIMTGFLSPPFGVEGNRELAIWLVREDGSVETGLVVTATEGSPETPLEFALRGNYPNPFNGSTTILFDLPQAAQVRLLVYDLLGRLVGQTASGEFQAGRKIALQFDGSGLSSGVYLYRMEMRSATGPQTRSGRFLQLK